MSAIQTRIYWSLGYRGDRSQTYLMIGERMRSNRFLSDHSTTIKCQPSVQALRMNCNIQIRRAWRSNAINLNLKINNTANGYEAPPDERSRKCWYRMKQRNRHHSR